MIKIKVRLKKRLDESYNIVIGRGLLKNPAAQLRSLARFSRYVIITDNAIRKIYGEQLTRRLKTHGFKAKLLSFPPGEQSKNQRTKTMLEETMLKIGCDRDTLIIALGGGVVGDIAGFVAATFMRGVPYVQIPTSLLAMVDSSLGGKTGIDTPQGKNLIGAFWQPRAVWVDLDFLKSLSEEQILNGFYEVVKISITSDKKLFRYLELNLDNIRSKDANALEHIVVRSLKIKASIVEKDERENDDRMILNFGHTIGHALENLSGYKLSHGRAVALGVITEAKISVLDGLLSRSEYDRIVDLLLRSGIDTSALSRWSTRRIIEAARADKKTRGGRLKVVLIEGIGRLHRRHGTAASFVSDRAIQHALQLV